MKKNFTFIISLLFSFQITSTAAIKEMPIIGYVGVPDWRTSEENFHTFSECGFNVSLHPYESLSLLVKACRYANKYGVKIIARCPEMTISPAMVAKTLKNENGFFGYLIQDEPTVPDIRKQEKLIKQLKAVDNTHIFYINLHPYYHDSWVGPTLKVKTYPEYLKTASATSCQQISFDFYPVTTAGIRPTWYHNLEMVRRESLVSKKPFWGFVLSVPHDVPFTPNTYYPQPTLASLKLQIYVNLAYGAQAIQYFTYWNPGDEEGFHYHDAPISRDEKKTKTWYLVQQMNKELKTVSRLFYGAKVLSVKHLGIIPQGCNKQNTMPTNLSSLKIVSSKGAIISQFEKNGHRYLAVVNKNHWDEITLLIKAKNNIPKHITKSLSEEPLKTSYPVSAGDMILFKLK